jgi:hypothetical protein
MAKTLSFRRSYLLPFCKLLGANKSFFTYCQMLFASLYGAFFSFVPKPYNNFFERRSWMWWKKHLLSKFQFVSHPFVLFSGHILSSVWFLKISPFSTVIIPPYAAGCLSPDSWIWWEVIFINSKLNQLCILCCCNA